MSGSVRCVDILCKVVDNFGDIGVVYRLAKCLSEEAPGLRLRLVVDGLAAFRAINPAVDPAKDVQELRGWTVVRWDAPWEGFRTEPPRRVIEAFACGRPEWLEEIMFDPADGAKKLIVNLEHLSAESYAEDFHRMDSLTRSVLVKKSIFMPGFTPKTGGLLIDRHFRQARERFLDPEGRRRGRLAVTALARLNGTAAIERFWVSVFSYERDYSRIVGDLSVFNRERPLLVLAAAGKSQACFLRAWEEAQRPFPVVELPFLRQEKWDDMVLASDFAIVRGEDSLARAALSGRPFLWQAYLQEKGHQLVKVAALLERMRPSFRPESFAPIERLFLAFNDRPADDPGQRGLESLLPVLRLQTEIEAGFRSLSEELVGLGNLGSHLMTFLSDFV